ncbi:MAG: pitrilysin family protein [Thermodesulfobacteriota bacterium]|nr:pitrilysin family protein [Thermodesulfobacteriota bacterium]
MRTGTLLILLTLLFTLTACTPSHVTSRMEEESESTPVPFCIPQPERIELANKIPVYIMEDHHIPLVNVVAFVRTGSIFDPEDMSGLAELTGVVLRTGGTTHASGDEIDRTLEFAGAHLEISLGLEMGRISLSVLSEDFNLGLSILADVLKNPAFSEEKLTIARNQKIESLRRIEDHASTIAQRVIRKLLYKGNPRELQPTIRSLKRIQRDDLIRFHTTHFQPDHIIFGVSGDITKEDVYETLNTYFGNWKQEGETPPHILPPRFHPDRNVNFVFKDIPQTTILLGNVVEGKKHPDFYALRVLNFVIGGGGFNTRMTKQIRTARGLAYVVGSNYRAGSDYGVLTFVCQTKPESTGEVIGILKDILEDVKKNGITEKELNWAKKSILNTFIFSFTTPLSVVSSFMKLEYEGLPCEYLFTYRERIEEVSCEDIQRVAAAYLHPDGATLLVIGNDVMFQSDASPRGDGKINRITLTLE